MNMHTIIRTSPKGQTDFVGTCSKCGLEGLTLDNMNDECENVRNVSQEQSLLEVVDPTKKLT